VVSKSRKECLSSCSEDNVCLGVDGGFECVQAPNVKLGRNEDIGNADDECAKALCPRGASCKLSGSVAQCFPKKPEKEEDESEEEEKENVIKDILDKVKERKEKEDEEKIAKPRPGMPMGAKPAGRANNIGRQAEREDEGSNLSDDKIKSIINSVNAEIGRKGSHWNEEEDEAEPERAQEKVSDFKERRKSILQKLKEEDEVGKRKDKLQRLYNLMQKKLKEEKSAESTEAEAERVMDRMKAIKEEIDLLDLMEEEEEEENEDDEVDQLDQMREDHNDEEDYMAQLPSAERVEKSEKNQMETESNEKNMDKGKDLIELPSAERIEEDDVQVDQMGGEKAKSKEEWSEEEEDLAERPSAKKVQGEGAASMRDDEVQLPSAERVQGKPEENKHRNKKEIEGEAVDLVQLPSAERVQEEPRKRDKKKQKRNRITEFNDLDDLRVIADPVMREEKDFSEEYEGSEVKTTEIKNVGSVEGEELSFEEMESDAWEKVGKDNKPSAERVADQLLSAEENLAGKSSSAEDKVAGKFSSAEGPADKSLPMKKAAGKKPLTEKKNRKRPEFSDDLQGRMSEIVLPVMQFGNHPPKPPHFVAKKANSSPKRSRKGRKRLKKRRQLAKIKSKENLEKGDTKYSKWALGTKYKKM